MSAHTTWGRVGSTDDRADGGGSGGFPGVTVAGITALISGLSVFVNSYGVHAIAAPSVYTTAKNVVATLVLASCAMMARPIARRRAASGAGRFVTVNRPTGPGTAPRPWRTWGPARWIGLAYVGVVGGGIAFVLFFDGLADTTATPAAFWRDTLVLWVALLAIPLLRERPTRWNIAAVAVLVAGEISITGGVGHLSADRGEVFVLTATVLWAVEVVVAKLLLRDMATSAVALVRMGVGSLALVVYLGATGALHLLWSLGADQLGWALLTGLLLAAYVGTWMTALARARAIDVTSVLVASAVVTALLQAAAGTRSLVPQALGLILILGGTATVLWASHRARVPQGSDVVSA
ncbi:MAG TPA: DMT family transporter [Acidimicrobiales bacterium]|nr:DMT family transporter [Acidimicrobiales bacterium]